ncbi:hypothetical protein [Microbulbifer sp. JMSA003]|uniref:hypothetical protein n=1 Tax=Microbulbifer sp. JMSA003 TaxID=3243369 RepID=UPI00403985E1
MPAFYSGIRLLEKAIKLITILLIPLLISSCVVLHEEYFFPQATGGKVEKEWCRGHVGVDNQLIFSFDEVEVKMKVWEYQKITRLDISFKLYSKSEVVWPQQSLFVTANSSRTSIEVKSFDRLILKGDDDITSETYLADTIMKKKNNLDYEIFYESFIVSKRGVESIELSSFYLMINGKKQQIPLSEFSKKSGFFLHPLNC